MRDETAFEAQRAWMRRVALSLVFAAAVGLLVFIVARGISGALLFVEHQELLRSAAAAVRTGIEGLPTADLRTARLRAERSMDLHTQIGLLCAFAAAALTAVGSYLWLEQRAARNDQ
ncbi:MAG: hypothetical protein NZ699_03020 [Roseiflexus sp.]|nr:hypothetical protein [Roseiflexus sp.]MDW8147164.1 hypothetical protein [Roseiflexaceae bacterium]MDW8231564.1 hypothetical protein [Roseiflexaceae bacterium]